MYVCMYVGIAPISILVSGLTDTMREFPNPYHTVVVKRTHVDNNVMIGDRRRQIVSLAVVAAAITIPIFIVVDVGNITTLGELVSAFNTIPAKYILKPRDCFLNLFSTKEQAFSEKGHFGMQYSRVIPRE